MTPMISSPPFSVELAGLDRDAQGGANAQVVNAFALAEALVGHGVAGENAFAGG